MMLALVERAKKMGLKFLILSTFASTKRAIHVYEKAGSVQTGFVHKKPLRDSKCIDDIIIARLME
jgi:ribosomal protein S18 acetylase RimI-like enzyme